MKFVFALALWLPGSPKKLKLIAGWYQSKEDMRDWLNGELPLLLEIEPNAFVLRVLVRDERASILGQRRICRLYYDCDASTRRGG